MGCQALPALHPALPAALPAEPARSSGIQTQCPAASGISLCLLPVCFYRAAFFCHFWLGGKLCLNKQEGGLFGSSPSPLSFPLVFWLFLPSLFIPLGAQTLAELLRLQRGCSSRSHVFTFHFVEREKEQMLGAGELPWAGNGVIATDVEPDPCWPT